MTSPTIHHHHNLKTLDLWVLKLVTFSQSRFTFIKFSSPDQGEPETEMDNAAIVSDPGSSHYLPGHSKPYDPRAAADAQESMKAKVIAMRKKLVEQVSAQHLYHCVNSAKALVCSMLPKVFWGDARGKDWYATRGSSCAVWHDEVGQKRGWGCLLLQVLFAVWCQPTCLHIIKQRWLLFLCVGTMQAQSSVNPSLTCLLSAGALSRWAAESLG